MILLRNPSDLLNPAYQILSRITNPYWTIRSVTLSSVIDLMKSGFPLLLLAEDKRADTTYRELSRLTRYLMTVLDVEKHPLCHQLMQRLIYNHVLLLFKDAPDKLLLMLCSCIQPSAVSSCWQSTKAVAKDEEEHPEQEQEQTLSVTTASSAPFDFDTYGDLSEPDYYDEKEDDEWKPVGSQNCKAVQIQSLNNSSKGSSSVGTVSGLPATVPAPSAGPALRAKLSQMFSKLQNKKHDGGSSLNQASSIISQQKKNVLKLLKEKSSNLSNSTKLKKLHLAGVGIQMSLRANLSDAYWIPPRLVCFEDVRELGAATRLFSIHCARMALGTLLAGTEAATGEPVNKVGFMDSLRTLLSQIPLQLYSNPFFFGVEIFSLLQSLISKYE